MRIIPCSALDVGTARELVLTFGLVIDSRLDAKKLKEMLLLLVEHKFPRAGSRLALRNGVCLFIKYLPIQLIRRTNQGL
jgi:hypothetical protein